MRSRRLSKLVPDLVEEWLAFVEESTTYSFHRGLAGPEIVKLGWLPYLPPLIPHPFKKVGGEHLRFSVGFSVGGAVQTPKTDDSRAGQPPVIRTKLAALTISVVRRLKMACTPRPGSGSLRTRPKNFGCGLRVPYYDPIETLLNLWGLFWTWLGFRLFLMVSI